MEGINFTMEELQDIHRRAEVIARLNNKEINIDTAVQRLQLSERQIYRLLDAYRNNGLPGLIHGNKLRPTNTGFPEDFKDQIAMTYLGAYGDYNFSHFCDKLLDDYGLKISYSALANILAEHDITSPKKHRHSAKAHPPKDRMENAGELIQADASKHQWLALVGDDKYYHLHGMIDDCTTIVPALWLEEQETNHGYQMCMYQMIKRYGLPAWMLTDNRGTFSANRKLTIDEELAGKMIGKTHFVEMLERLGIGITTTSIAEAKGLIERLWGPLQDRLPKELRDHGISNIKEANQFITNDFLPRYNKRFASPIDYNKNYFQKVPNNFDYNLELALVYKKRIYNNTYLQLDSQNYALFLDGKMVKLHATGPQTIYRCLDGKLRLQYSHKWYELRPISAIRRKETLPKDQSSLQPGCKPKKTSEELSIIRSQAARKANTPWRQTNSTIFRFTDKV